MLELLVGEAHERFERGLVAEPVIAADLEHLRADEALDEAEHVGVGAPLDLAQQAALGVVQEVETPDERQAVGQKLLREIELAAANHVAVDVPADALRDFDALCVAVAVGAARLAWLSPW